MIYCFNQLLVLDRQGAEGAAQSFFELLSPHKAFAAEQNDGVLNSHPMCRIWRINGHAE